MNLRNFRLLTVMLWTAVILLTFATIISGEEVQPDFILSKELYQHPKLGEHVRITHRVVRGESLWKILERVYGWERKRVIEAIRLTTELNPAIKNPDLIYPDQEFIMPIPVPQEEAPIFPEERRPIPPTISLPESTPPMTSEPTPTPISPTPTPTMIPTAIPTPTPTPTPMVKTDIRLGIPSTETSIDPEQQSVLQAITDLFRLLGFRTQDSGDLVVSIDDGGTLILETQFYPIVYLPGWKMILDPWNGISTRDEVLLKRYWPDNEVISLGPGLSPKIMIDKALEAARFNRFKRQEEVACGRKVQLSFLPDWQVVTDEESFIEGGVIHLISYLQVGEPSLPPEWKTFLTRFGLNLLEIGPGVSPPPDQDTSPLDTFVDIQNYSVKNAVTELAAAFGLETRDDLSIRVSDRLGLPTPPIKVDLTITREKNLFLIDFATLRPEEIHLLSSYQNRLLVINPDELPTHWVPRLLTTVGLPTWRITSYFAEGAEGKGILKIPALRIDDPSGTILLVDGQIRPELLYYLRRKGYRIGIY